jgi:multidrug efflux pump subunit AcrA (membrane-fusion protein)
MSVQPNTKPDLSGLRIDRSEREPSSSSPIKWLVFALLLASLLGAVYFMVIAPRRATVVETVTVQPILNVRDEQLLTATGYLVADRQAAVTAKIAGRITKLNFDVGSLVKKGEILVVLESADMQADLREAEASYSNAAREYRRQ